MKGKILGAGAISGEDGIRYYYDEKELKNLKEGQKLEGCEVDFDIKDGKAVGVYITKGGGFNADFGKIGAKVGASLEKGTLPKFDSKHIFWDLNEAKANLFRPNMHSVKFCFLVIVVINLITNVGIGSGSESEFSNRSSFDLGPLFWIFGILNVALLLWVSFCVSTLSKPYALLKFATIAFVSWLLFQLLPQRIAAAYLMSMGEIPYFKILLAIILGLTALVYAFKWFKLLSQTTGEKVYMWSFYLIIATGICYTLFTFINGLVVAKENPYKFMKYSEHIMTFVDIIAFVVAGLFAYATLKFREIKQIS